MQNPDNSLINLFYRLPQNIAECFRGLNLVWQLCAFVLTYFAVVSGFDWQYFLFFQGSLIYKLLFPAVGVGLLVPVFAPLVFLTVGAIKKKSHLLNTGYALAQAAFLGWLFSSFYKIVTGRSGPPESFGMRQITDMSHVFKFGFFRGGIFWGWRSSHTTTAFAVACALVMLYPKNKWIKTIAITYALYVGLGVSMSIHWFSDFVAGAIFGTIIGVSAGRSFWERINQDKA